MTKLDHNFSDVSKKFEVHSLMSIYNYNDVLFLFNSLLNNNCILDKLEIFKFRTVHYNIRKPRQLLEENGHLDSPYYSPVYRLKRTWNSLNIDLNDFSNFRNFKGFARQKFLSTIIYYYVQT